MARYTLREFMEGLRAIHGISSLLILRHVYLNHLKGMHINNELSDKAMLFMSQHMWQWLTMTLMCVNETINRMQFTTIWWLRHKLALSDAVRTVQGYWLEKLNLMPFFQLFLYMFRDLTQHLAHRPAWRTNPPLLYFFILFIFCYLIFFLLLFYFIFFSIMIIIIIVHWIIIYDRYNNYQCDYVYYYLL